MQRARATPSTPSGASAHGSGELGPSGALEKRRRRKAQLLGLAVVAVFLLVNNALRLRQGSADVGGGRAPRRPAEARQLAAADGVADIISEPTHARGRVEKAGILELENWHRLRSKLRNEKMVEWRRVRRHMFLDANASSEGALLAAADWPRYPPPPVYPGCHVFVNHLYRIIYVRHPKAASTSLMRFFGKCVDGNTSYNSSCLEPLFTQKVDEEEARRMWREYFVFTFVRNPYDRAVSSYRMMMRYLVWEKIPLTPEEEALLAEINAEAEAAKGEGRDPPKRKRPHPRHQYKSPAARKYNWDKFCADPLSFEQLCKVDPICSQSGPTFVLLHMQSQGACVTTPDGGWAVDFVGSVEQIDEDLNGLLDILDARRDEGLPALPRLEAPLPNVNGLRCVEADSSTSAIAAPPESYCSREQYFMGKHAECLPRMQEFFRKDLDALFS